jgi:glycosyltransferase involved in cell wall biosynthesis
MGKKNKNNKFPLVSILTPTFRRNKFLPLLFDCILKQDYPLNKIEWVIVNGENDEKKYDEIPNIIKNMQSINNNIKINYCLHPMNDKNKIGGLRNKSNEIANGKIMVCMDDDDYYLPDCVSKAVKVLKKRKIDIFACKSNYLYDFDIDVMIYVGNFKKNLCINNSFCYKKSYWINNRYRDSDPFSEERYFTKNYSCKFFFDNTLKYVIQFSHLSNTFNKRRIFDKAYLYETDNVSVNEYQKTEKKILDLIPLELYKKYELAGLGYERHKKKSKYDIVYHTGGLIKE